MRQFPWRTRAAIPPSNSWGTGLYCAWPRAGAAVTARGPMRRRDVLRGGRAGGGILAVGRGGDAWPTEGRARVVVIKAEDRADGVRRAVRLLGVAGFERKRVVVK